MARGEEGPDSDIDLLVVLADVREGEKLRLLGELIQVGSIAPPVDAIPTDEAELAERGHLPGMLRVALREGRVVYEQL
ncbi:MAG: nucleotidyltransferase domain-containing protein [Egibacteraceae bacterium]